MYASAAPVLMKKDSLKDVRRSVTYHPTIWGDHFLKYTPELTDICDSEEKEIERQKEEVKKLLVETPDDSTLKLDLIDAIQRLGVGYHFEQQIEKSLRHIRDITYNSNCENENLRIVSLRFRLLRQQGYHIPCDVFKKFQDDEGNFNEGLISGVEGLLSLYEASNYGIDGEEILDNALQFSSYHLKSNLVHPLTNSLSTLIEEALNVPISKTLIRLGATKFIPIYQQNESHNQILLNFAKLDFNKVQKMHQKELCQITRWWKNLDFTNKLPFARDRVVECYFWILSVYFEPKYEFARRILTKVIAVTSIIDDIYDVYGTLDELQIFTDTLQSWEINEGNQLPPYMKICYEALLGVYGEMEDEMLKVGKSYRVQYAKDQMNKLIGAYFDEAKWYYNTYTPSMEEYMKVALVSGAYMMLSTTSLVGMGDDVSKEDFDWVSSEPTMVRAASIICRLMDDMVGYGIEQKITVVECYMNQNGGSKMEVFGELERQVKKAWKDMNRECLEPRAVGMPILTRVLNLARVINLLYVGEDSYGSSNGKTIDIIKCVLIDPVLF